jgi:energy-coupling factor transporter ATP-binding protein EcfA2
MRALDAEHYLLELKLKREKVPSFEQYPFSLPVVRHLHTLELHPKVTFIIGENGSGKSTLLEAIAIAWGFNPEGGTKNFNFQTRASHSVLHEHITLVKGIRRAKDGFFLRAESFFNVATEIERLDKEGGGPPIINSYGGISLHQQSHAPLQRQRSLRPGRAGSRTLTAATIGDDRATSPAGEIALSVRHRHTLTTPHGLSRRLHLPDRLQWFAEGRVRTDRALHCHQGIHHQPKTATRSTAELMPQYGSSGLSDGC